MLFFIFKLIRIRIEFWVALIAAMGALGINQLHYQDTLSFNEAANWMIQYFTFGNRFFVWFFLFVYLFFFAKLYGKLLTTITNYLLEKTPPPSQDKRELFLHLVQPFYLIAPIAIVTGPFWALLVNMSYELRFTRFDELFLRADFLLFNTYPFLSLPTIFSGDYVVFTLKWFYFSLAFAMSGNLIILYLLKREWLFRQAILVFLISLVIGFPLFFAFPCQDPGNYFLRNLRGYTLSSESRQALKEYRPSVAASHVITQIADVETNVGKDNTVPISCFPSMHAVWAIFVVYFIFKLTSFSLLITIPWLILLLTGGVYFAQHYVVDYIVAIPVAMASIFLANILLRFEAWYQGEGGKNCPSKKGG